MKNRNRPTYGLYFLTIHIVSLLFILCIGIFLVVLGISYIKSLFTIVGIIIIIYGLFSTGLAFVARYILPGRPEKIAADLIKALELRGDEVILDVGTGRGLYAIEAAKKLSRGKVIGIDIWDTKNVPQYLYHHKLSQPSGNTLENVKRNVEIAGVRKKVEFINMDAHALQFRDGYFDVIICAYVISHLGRYRDSVLKEIRRTLKAGGRLVVVDNIRDLTYVLLSTPHMFLWSYLRGKKAKYLTKEFWREIISECSFTLQSYARRPGIVKLVANK